MPPLGNHPQNRPMSQVYFAALLGILFSISRPSWGTPREPAFSTADPQGVPVYLAPMHPVSTGSRLKAELQARVLKTKDFRWVRVRDRKTQLEGWVLNDSLITPTFFANEVILLRGGRLLTNAPSPRFIRKNFKSPPSSPLRYRKILKPTEAKVLQRQDTFLEVKIFKKAGSITGWIDEKFTSPKTTDFGQLVVTQRANLRDKASKTSSVQRQLTPMTVLQPIEKNKTWWKIKLPSGQTGYIHESLVWSRMKSALRVRTHSGYKPATEETPFQKITEVFHDPLWTSNGDAQLSLKALPDMESHTVAEAPPWSQFITQGEAHQKWRLSHTHRGEKFWWPEPIHYSTLPLPTPKHNKRYRLNRASVLQEVQSPKAPGLRFATTERGVYVSRNSPYWRKLDQFRGPQVMAVHPSGKIYIGDKVSDDNGHTFKDYIRWDRLLGALQRAPLRTGKKLKIRDIEVQHLKENEIHLQLEVQPGQSFPILTSDGGQTWKLNFAKRPNPTPTIRQHTKNQSPDQKL